MQRYDNSRVNHTKYKERQWRDEHKSGGFKCSHCRGFVVIHEYMGTANRNHCNMCLWSKHVDKTKGDRRSTCHGGMQPIGLTFKHEGYDKVGEVMLIHLCSCCQKISINRIAQDDPEHTILDIFTASFELLDVIRQELAVAGIYLLDQTDKHQLSIQLFGK